MAFWRGLAFIRGVALGKEVRSLSKLTRVPVRPTRPSDPSLESATCWRAGELVFPSRRISGAE